MENVKVEWTFLDLLLGLLSIAGAIFAFVALKLDWPWMQVFLTVAVFCPLPIVLKLWGTYGGRHDT